MVKTLRRRGGNGVKLRHENNCFSRGGLSGMAEWMLAGAPSFLACGFVIGFLICYSGVGGGALAVPAAVLLFDMPVSMAVGSASVYAAATKVAAGAEHWRIGNVPWKMCGLFAAAAVPGVLLTAGPINYFTRDGGAEELQTALRYLVAGAIALSLLAAHFRPAAAGEYSPPKLLSAAFVIGMMMGATGIGGGILIVPALLLLSGHEVRKVIGASIVIAVALSALVAFVYAGGGQIDYRFAGWMLVGSLPAIIPASWALRRSSPKAVQWILNVLIVAVLVMMVWGEASRPAATI